MEEIEIKFRLNDPAEHARLRAALAALGARCEPPRREENTLFDTPAGDLARRGSAFRLRVIEGRPGGTLTFKGPARLEGGVKTRQEVQVEVAEPEAARQLLLALGFQPAISYSTDREPWRLGEVEILLDQLVFGTFCELEGPRDEILRLSRQLGLDPAAAEPATYPELMARHLGRVLKAED